MGFDYEAGSYDTIQPEVIERVVPGAWEFFDEVVNKVAFICHRAIDTVLADVGREDEHNDHDIDSADEEYADIVALGVTPALEQLRQAFRNATNGIDLRIGWVGDDTFHGSDLRDEVFWYITGHQQPTPAYRAFIAIHGKATTKTWITGG